MRISFLLLDLACYTLVEVYAFPVFAALPSGGASGDALAVSTEESSPGQVDWPALALVKVTSNVFRTPTCLTHAGDGSGRLFLVEQDGRVRIVQTNHVLAEPFLDITDRVLSGGERGLLGVAFPPGLAPKDHFYVDYTRKTDGATVISRFLIGADANVADTNFEQVLKVIPQPFANHNGGQLAFGPDGFLYIGMGDGGFSSASQPDPHTNAQNPASLLGKLLRIDVESGAVPYAVPASNPFVTNAAYAPEIWALGLRNPWRFSFDRLTGDLFIGDVGHDRFEEIDLQLAGSTGGQNYGWPICEGPTVLNRTNGCDFFKWTGPLTWYSHSEFPGIRAASVTGGYVYRGPNEPRMNGIYFFGDFITGQIWGLKRTGTNWQRWEMSTQNVLFPTMSTFGEDEQGRLYLTIYGEGGVGYLFELKDNHQVLPPAFSIPGGTVYSNTVTVTCPSPGALIHYTTDDRDPTELDPSVLSGGTIELTNGVTVKLQAFRADLAPSGVARATFTLKVGTPTFSPSQGPITNGTFVSITTITPDATIHYTLDGTVPDTNSPLYTGPIMLNGNTTLSARGFLAGFLDSDLQGVFYALVRVAIPEFDPPEGPLTNDTRISIHCRTPNATIRFTLDGSDPDTNAPLYSEPLIFHNAVTLMARAFRSDLDPSDIRAGFFGQVNVDGTVVTTLAGGPTAGFTNGLGAFARFSAPRGVCVDRHGTLYVADTGNNVIRKVSPSGEVSTFAGSGEPGVQDGPDATAQFSSPVGVAVDAAGNIYVADTGGCDRIRKIDTSGTVTTLAIVPPECVARNLGPPEVDPGGNVYVGSGGSIQKISPDGVVTGLAGGGCDTGWYPSVGVGIGSFTNSYAATGYHVLRVTPAGSVELFAGPADNCVAGPGFSDGPRLLSLFAGPQDVSVDASGNVFISDITRIRRVSIDGQVSTHAGTAQLGYRNGSGYLAQFNYTAGLCVDQQGNVHVADQGNNCIRKIWIDQDRDGIPDALEGGASPFVLGIDDRLVDSDHDGMSNTAEFFAGTDPSDSGSFFAIASVTLSSNGFAQIRWQSIVGKSYVVKYSDNLLTWTTLGPPVLGDGSFLVVTDPTAASLRPSRVFRVFLADF